MYCVGTALIPYSTFGINKQIACHKCHCIFTSNNLQYRCAYIAGKWLGLSIFYGRIDRALIVRLSLMIAASYVFGKGYFQQSSLLCSGSAVN